MSDARINLNRPISLRSILCRWDRVGGETLHSLARKHGIPVRLLQAAWKGREVSRRRKAVPRQPAPPHEPTYKPDPKPAGYYKPRPSPDLDQLL